jgi:hypothetical protein
VRGLRRRWASLPLLPQRRQEAGSHTPSPAPTGRSRGQTQTVVPSGPQAVVMKWMGPMVYSKAQLQEALAQLADLRRSSGDLAAATDLYAEALRVHR